MFDAVIQITTFVPKQRPAIASFLGGITSHQSSNHRKKLCLERIRIRQ